MFLHTNSHFLLIFRCAVTPTIEDATTVTPPPRRYISMPADTEQLVRFPTPRRIKGCY